MIADILYYEQNNPFHFEIISGVFIKDINHIPVVWSSGTLFFSKFDEPVGEIIKLYPEVTIVEN
jgi:hypothetical protein